MSIVEKAMRKQRERASRRAGGEDAAEHAGESAAAASAQATGSGAAESDPPAVLAVDGGQPVGDGDDEIAISAFDAGGRASVVAQPSVVAGAAGAAGASQGDGATDGGTDVPAPPAQPDEAIRAGDSNRPLPRSPSGGAKDAGVRHEVQGDTLQLSEEALREGGLLPAEPQTRQIDDQYRRIKRPLLARAFGINMPRLDRGNLMMVASSLPGEGKSFTSFNLALSMAREPDRTVLLVDADVAKPHLTRAMNLEERRGLIDLLLDSSLDLQDVILRTNIERLRFLPAGPLHRNSTELLASERMAQLVEELSARYPDRLIIFDTPPLLPTTEAQAMAHLMGQIVVVVHAGHTPQTAVRQSLEMLKDSAEIGFVLNKTRTAWGEEYSHYGNYRGYGYGVD